MVIGEKLWEGKAKTMSTAVKRTHANGVKLEYTWMVQLKGMAKAKGFDGQVLFTGNIVISPTGEAGTLGTGLFTIMTGDMAVFKGSGYGRPEETKRQRLRHLEFHDHVAKAVVDERGSCFDNPSWRCVVDGV